MEIKHRIRIARNAAGITQQQLADRLISSRTYITQLETGVRTGSPAFHLRLRDALGVTPAWWETGEGAILVGEAHKNPTIEIKDKVIIIRLALKLSQEELGRRVGYSQGSISLIEGGRRSASLKFIRMMIQTLEVASTWWENGEGPMFGSRNGHPKVAEYAEGPHEA
jgi:transcriptional regulator with XRE-family HTH domain